MLFLNGQSSFEESVFGEEKNELVEGGSVFFFHTNRNANRTVFFKLNISKSDDKGQANEHTFCFTNYIVNETLEQFSY